MTSASSAALDRNRSTIKAKINVMRSDIRRSVARFSAPCQPNSIYDRDTCKAVGIVGVTFHDLRGTAVTRLALAGCTEAEIATITGLSLRNVRAILDSHYLNRDPALAVNAIRKLEKRTKAPD